MIEFKEVQKYPQSLSKSISLANTQYETKEFETSNFSQIQLEFFSRSQIRQDYNFNTIQVLVWFASKTQGTM